MGVIEGERYQIFADWRLYVAEYFRIVTTTLNLKSVLRILNDLFSIVIEENVQKVVNNYKPESWLLIWNSIIQLWLWCLFFLSCLWQIYILLDWVLNETFLESMHFTAVSRINYVVCLLRKTFGLPLYEIGDSSKQFFHFLVNCLLHLVFPLEYTLEVVLKKF